jgi:ribonuclease BN (tRNA processing enzyme)
MINKIKVEKFLNKYDITYSVDSGKNLTDILRRCKASIEEIEIEEDADVGCASYGGSYTFDQLDEKYNLNYPYFDAMYIDFKNDDTRFVYYGYQNELSIKTRDPNFDLEAFVAEKSKQLKVLGSVSPYCKDEMNCPGYLIDSGKGKILLDCGFGSSGNMSFPEDIRDLNIIISHYHKDHYADLFAILYAGLCHKSLGEEVSINIYIPETCDENTVYDYELIKNNHDGAFKLHTYNEGSRLNICGCSISFKKTVHSIENFSVCVENNNTKLVYSGDMGYYNIEEYSKFCRNADVFICESTFLSTDSNKSRYHLDAKEAAMIAKAANVRKLLLTHTWPEHEKDLYLKEARSVYDKVYMAHENDVIKIETAR